MQDLGQPKAYCAHKLFFTEIKGQLHRFYAPQYSFLI